MVILHGVIDATHLGAGAWRTNLRLAHIRVGPDTVAAIVMLFILCLLIGIGIGNLFRK